MTERVLAQISRPEELWIVNRLLHDASFSMPDVTYERGEGVVRLLLFAPPGGRKRWFLKRVLRSDAAGRAALRLSVARVLSMSICDAAGIDWHSYAGLEASDSDRLVMKSHFPGQIEFVVSGIDIRVVTTS